MYLFHIKNEEKSERLTKQDLPYTIGMIVLDIAAPIFLMLGISMGTASNASLLGNFEIVAITLIVVYDTMVKHHLHGHTHTIVHTHNGVTHTHVITHEHDHNHFGNEGKHDHKHEDYMNSKKHELAHAQGM